MENSISSIDNIDYNIDWCQEVQNCVPRETFTIIKAYINYLLQWNTKISLISKSITSQDIYLHVLDAVLIDQYIKETVNDITKCSIADVGSGAGILGIILAIMTSYKQCSLIEIKRKKSFFLNEVLKEFSLNAIVYNVNSAQLTIGQNIDYIDIIVSKAVSEINLLLNASKNLISSNTRIVVHKSLNQVHKEIEDSLKRWNFNFSIIKNIYRNKSVIVIIDRISAIQK